MDLPCTKSPARIISACQQIHDMKETSNRRVKVNYEQSAVPLHLQKIFVIALLRPNVSFSQLEMTLSIFQINVKCSDVENL